MITTTPSTELTPKDFTSDQEIRWCPGCGDYSILAQVKKILPTLGVPQEKIVFISGIGCSSRFPYYVHAYGLHGIHGRAISIATGVKCANPELNVWVVTGDGDGMSIGGNHLIHAIRRNINLVILLFNNRIYGLTKGQYSPTSELGKKTKTSPLGTIEHPMKPISLALGAEATFVARAIDVDVKHLAEVLKAAAEHTGTSFVEIYQNCAIFNHNAYAYATDKDTRDEHILFLEQGRPLVFGKNRDKGIRMNGPLPEVVQLGNGITEKDLVVHNETAEDSSPAFMLSRMTYPDFPEPMGVFRRVRRPSYDELMKQQFVEAEKLWGPGDMNTLLRGTETWEVK